MSPLPRHHRADAGFILAREALEGAGTVVTADAGLVRAATAADMADLVLWFEDVAEAPAHDPGEAV